MTRVPDLDQAASAKLSLAFILVPCLTSLSNSGRTYRLPASPSKLRREPYKLIRPTLLPSRAHRSGRRDLCAPALQHLVRGPRAGLWTSLRLYGARSSPHRRGPGRRHSLLGCESHLRVRRCEFPAFLTRRRAPGLLSLFQSPRRDQPLSTVRRPASRVGVRTQAQQGWCFIGRLRAYRSSRVSTNGLRLQQKLPMCSSGWAPAGLGSIAVRMTTTARPIIP
jgi:hypothetical protein